VSGGTKKIRCVVAEEKWRQKRKFLDVGTSIQRVQKCTVSLLYWVTKILCGVIVFCLLVFENICVLGMRQRFVFSLQLIENFPACEFSSPLIYVNGERKAKGQTAKSQRF
jgi:hypothetical protein